VSVPGQVESCVTILRNILAQLSNTSEATPGAELIVRYIDTFLPRADKAKDAPQGEVDMEAS